MLSAQEQELVGLWEALLRRGITSPPSRRALAAAAVRVALGRAGETLVLGGPLERLCREELRSLLRSSLVGTFATLRAFSLRFDVPGEEQLSYGWSRAREQLLGPLGDMVLERMPEAACGGGSRALEVPRRERGALEKKLASCAEVAALVELCQLLGGWRLRLPPLPERWRADTVTGDPALGLRVIVGHVVCAVVEMLRCADSEPLDTAVSLLGGPHVRGELTIAGASLVAVGNIIDAALMEGVGGVLDLTERLALPTVAFVVRNELYQRRSG